MLHFYLEKIGHFQEIKYNQFTNGDQDEMRPISGASSLNSQNIWYILSCSLCPNPYSMIRSLWKFSFYQKKVLDFTFKFLTAI